MQSSFPKSDAPRRGRGRPPKQPKIVPYTDLDERPSPSPSKRPKLDHAPRTPTSGAASRMKDVDMYSNLPSSHIIDLTKSPQRSPAGSSAAPRSANPATTNGARTLVVKNFRTTTRSDPEIFYRQTWAALERALDIIFKQDTRAFSLEELYRGVENICRQGKADPLFQGLKTQCKRHVSQQVKGRLVERASAVTDVGMLEAVTEAWATWKRQLTTIRSIFYYMDRSYLLHAANLPQIEELGTNLFRDQVFSNPSINPKILDGACALIAMDRTKNTGEAFDPKLFREAVSMFHGLYVYTSDFEPRLMKDSDAYFKEWASSNASRLKIGQYVQQAKDLFASESSRCDSFDLDKSTQRQLVTQMEDIVVAGQCKRMTTIKDFAELLSNYQFDFIRDLFELLQRKSLGEKLRPAFEANIKSMGSAIVFDEKRVSDMVVRLLHFKRQLDTVWTSCFKKHQSLGYGLKEAFEDFINKTEKTKITWDTDNDKPGEMIAKYLDMILRGGVKAIPQNPEEMKQANAEDEEADDEELDEDEQMNKQLDQVLELFRFVHGKATFEAFYKKDLAKRLLMNRSASADAEKSMLTRLKSECGAGFTQNLEQMFKDIELARDENASYKTHLESRQPRKPRVDLNVNVLSAAAWPTYPDVAFEIPAEIQAASASFEEHYKAKHTGRKLLWKPALAHCLLKAHFLRSAKEVIVSAFQAVVLLHFNGRAADAPPVPYAELQAATKLDDVELPRTLQSLACARYRVLTKTPKGKDVRPTDTFALNTGFTDPKYRIKINQIQLKETREENKATHERVAADRQYETQAAVVRIMKGRKALKHAQLVALTIDATKSRGSINPEDIKKQIEKYAGLLPLHKCWDADHLLQAY